MRTPHATVALLLVAGLSGCGVRRPARVAGSSAGFSSSELVLRLLDSETRLDAYYELSRRAAPDEAPDLATFRSGHRDPEVVTCRQGGGQPPLTLVLSRFLDDDSWAAAPPGPPASLRRRDDLLVEVFTSAGERIAPFGGNNVLDGGVVADLNGDGLVERASRTDYRVEGVENVQVLEVSTVRPAAEPLLTVVYNWGEREEWDYRFVERGGRVEVELGPITRESILPKAVFRWDERVGRYVESTGSAGDHFRVVDGRQTWAELQRLRGEGLAFAADPDFVPPADPFDRVPPEVARQVASAEAYRAGSLRSLSFDGIARFMGKGRSVHQLELDRLQENRLPEGFWDLPTGDAALALAETNRSEEHRRAYTLELPRDAERLEAGTVFSTDRSAPCYVRSLTHVFLKADPVRSYLAVVQASRAGTVFADFVDDRTEYDIRIRDLPYRDARHVLSAVASLAHIRHQRTGRRANGGMRFSTADGRGDVEVRGPHGETVAAFSGSTWGRVADRWTEGFDEEVALNLATFLVGEALAESLWPGFGERAAPELCAHDELDRGPGLEERRELSAAIAALLSTYTPGGRGLPIEMAGIAVAAAGDHALEELSPALTRIRETEWGVLGDAGRLRAAAALSQRQVVASRRPDLLTAWADSADKGNMWALRELLRRDPASAVPVLERWLARTTGDERRQVFEALARAAPQRAREVLSGMPSVRRKELLASGAELGALTGLEVAELLQVATAGETGWQQRLDAIRLLVPPEAPLRHRSPAVDATLVKLLEPMPGDDLRFALAHASRALALRGRFDLFDVIRGHLDAGGPLGFENVLSALSLLAARGTAGHRAALAAVIRPHLQKTDRMVTELLWSAFAADLRELRPDLERIATRSPEDVEGEKANTSGGTATPVNERYHLARKILSLWDEPDDLTRAKLLTALAFAENVSPAGYADQIERVDRIAASLTSALSRLSGQERDEAVAFLRYCQDHVRGGSERSLPTALDPKAAVIAVLATPRPAPQ